MPFCAECKRHLRKNMYHCHICGRCIYRYDHHCPWINNCVGSHNIGRFTLFLALLAFGLLEVIFCSVCLLIGEESLVRYRTIFDMPNGIHIFINVITILFGLIIMIAIINLLIDQLKNLFTNSTGF